MGFVPAAPASALRSTPPQPGPSCLTRSGIIPPPRSREGPQLCRLSLLGGSILQPGMTYPNRPWHLPPPHLVGLSPPLLLADERLGGFDVSAQLLDAVGMTKVAVWTAVWVAYLVA